MPKQRIKIEFLEGEVLDKLEWGKGQTSEFGKGFRIILDGKKEYTWFIAKDIPLQDIAVFLVSSLNAMLDPNFAGQHSKITKSKKGA